MRVRRPNFNGELLILAVLIGIDLLVGVRAVQRLVLHQGEVMPDAPFFLLLLLALQVALILVFSGWKRTLADHERLRASYEHELELSRQIMESVDVGVAVLDAEGRYRYLNRAACDLLGVTCEALLGKAAEELINGTGGRSYQELTAQSIASPQLRPVTVRRSDGQLLSALVKVTPRWYEGRVVGVITSVIPCGPGVANRAEDTEGAEPPGSASG